MIVLWELTCLSWDDLLEGMTVVYVDVGRAEAGTVTSWDRELGTVWARYSTGDTAAGASIGDLWHVA